MKSFSEGKHMFHSKRFALLVAVVALSATGAVAQTNSYDIPLQNQVTVNNCSAGEPVALNGHVQIWYSFTTDSAGVNHFSITAANNLSGNGKNTGAFYTAADSNECGAASRDSSADLTVELTSELRSQAAAVSLELVQTLHIIVDTSGNITAAVTGNTTGCGN